jgi:signal transduction histidine kinase/ActR/RegA family two-component response regulator
MIEHVTEARGSLEGRVRALREELARAEVELRASRGETALPCPAQGGADGAPWSATDPEQVEVARREEAQRAVALRQAAESAVRAKDEFLAMLGHELRNPLAPILTAVQLLRLRAGDQFARERAIIERQAQHMMRLVDDLLDVSRLTRGKIVLKRQRVDVGEAIARAVELASPLFEERAHRLDLSLPAGLVVDGDSDRLVQVFANLLTNAAKYTPSGGRVEVEAYAVGEAVRVVVRDTGVGLSPALLPVIFDAFVQGERHLDRGQGGLGLGLALVKQLTELHGGRVAARSEGPGRGSEFVVELPACAARAAAPEGRAGEAERRPGGRRVLVVDDNADAAEMLAEGLRLHGHRVGVAHDGPQALRVAEALSPEIALLDLDLPVMDGYELGHRLRERLGPTCQLVAVTGYGQEADLVRTRREGFLAHVVKPVELDAVRELVRCLRPPEVGSAPGAAGAPG